MAEERVQRRLAAILAADVVGYSRLMGEDEEGTLAAMTAHISELFEPCITTHRGRIVKTTGDGLLAEFASVVDSVRCAVAIQEGMAARNADVSVDRLIGFRIGVNLGDVIIQQGDVYGDGVNVAARLEGLAEAGGIVVSAKVRDEVQGKVHIAFDDLGAQEVKNIAAPVPAFRVCLETESSDRNRAGERSSHHPSANPSIAVLPFDNMSGDPEQDYFADGLTEDVITVLSRIRSFSVIARNSAFAFKGKATDLRRVSEQLGVLYVVEGSVRKASNRVRVSAQLIEGATGSHIWADRYDRDLDDIFEIQDEITNEIVVALQVELSEGEQARLRRGQTTSVAAWDSYVRGLSEHRRTTREGAINARQHFENAVRIDPGFGTAWVLLGRSHWQAARASWTDDTAATLERAAGCAGKALEI